MNKNKTLKETLSARASKRCSLIVAVIRHSAAMFEVE